MKARGQRPYRQGGSKQQSGYGSRGQDRRRPPHGPQRGPTVCPMCGVAVADLKAHIRMKHDDAASHPRD